MTKYRELRVYNMAIVNILLGITIASLGLYIAGKLLISMLAVDFGTSKYYDYLEEDTEMYINRPGGYED